jgi:hypothetical protein
MYCQSGFLFSFFLNLKFVSLRKADVPNKYSQSKGKVVKYVFCNEGRKSDHQREQL